MKRQIKKIEDPIYESKWKNTCTKCAVTWIRIRPTIDKVLSKLQNVIDNLYIGDVISTSEERDRGFHIILKTVDGNIYIEQTPGDHVIQKEALWILQQKQIWYYQDCSLHAIEIDNQHYELPYDEIPETEWKNNSFIKGVLVDL